MIFIADAAERVTAATDLLMAIVALVGIIQFRSQAGFKVNLWTLIYALFIAAALLGTVHHGFSIPATVYDATWLGVLFFLGIMIGFFVVALVLDLFGQRWALRTMPLMLVISISFFLYSTVIVKSEDLSVFLIYQAVATLVALAGWSWLAVRRRPGALSMSLGVLVTMIAAAVQATEAISYTLIVPFDHNANYHLIQCCGVLLLTNGILRSTQPEGR